MSNVRRQSGQKGEDVMNRLMRGAALGLSLFLAACAGQQEIPFDRTSDNIKTIGLLHPDMPGQPTIWLASDVGQSFGLVGALIDLSIQADRDKRYMAAIQSQNYQPVDAFTQELVAAIQSHGYSAKLMPDARKQGDGFMKTYPTDPGVDAYLDVVSLGYGYVAAGIGSANPYRPFATVNVRLIRASDHAVLLQDIVAYNPVNGTAKAVTISPDPAYQFPDSSALDADPKLAISGEDAALKQTADSVGTLLR
jgi:hypothetical protein